MKKRKRTRLIEYDYRNSGYYFITICVKTETLLGRIINGKIQLNTAGEIVKKCWFDLPNHYKNCKLDYYVIMPDHFHGIVIIDNDINLNNHFNIVGEGLRPSPTEKSAKHGLPEIIRAFKSFSSHKINESNYFREKFHWQRSFYDRIIRNEREFYFIRKYIQENPLKRELDGK